MSIATTAPQKFDFQDIACVEMMLRFAHVTDARFFVEPNDGEDGELRFGAAAPMLSAEIQVKGAAGAVTLATVATCLAHTPPRSSKNTLLERLVSDPKRLAVFVMSGRCDDASAPYTVSFGWDGTPHRAGHVTIAQTAELLNAFAKADVPGSGSSALRAKRIAHNASIAKTIDKGAVRAALSRLIIVERMDEAELEARCADRLRRHRVASDRIADIVGRLRGAVKSAKASKADAFPCVRAVLQAAVPPPVRPVDYVDRGIETALVEALSCAGVLLLSGTPRVGKTWAARRTAAEFEPHGYEVRELNDVEQAERFLLDPTDAPRLAILDDPLGGTYPIADPARILARIVALIPRLQPHRRLIVVQRTDQLLATARALDLSTLRTANHPWHDLGALPPRFLAKVWRSLADAFGVSRPLRQFVSEALSDGSLRLEPGCLQHLAVNYARSSSPLLSLDKITRLAHEDAAGLGNALAEAGYEPMLSALALTTTAKESIEFPELAFAMGAGGGGLPSRSNGGGGMILAVGGPALPAPLAPTYDEAPRLTANQINALDELERRRMIEVGAGQSVGFVHPFYRAAAEALIDGLTHARAVRITTTVLRALFCLSPLTSRATARNLELAFDRLAPRAEARATLVDHAVAGLRSFYPATRDLCFRFLVRHLADLSVERRNQLRQWIPAVTSINLYSLEWTDGHAHLPYGTMSGTDYLERMFNIIKRGQVATELALLEGNEGDYLSPERAAKTLSFLVKEPQALSSRAVERFLSFDEAAIRAEAIKLWLQEPRVNDRAVLARVFADDHPGCALAALKGAIMGWSMYIASRRQIVLEGLRCLAASAACAVAMIDQLVLFDRVEVTGKEPPWSIFEALLPDVMRALPHNVNLIDARLFGVAQSAVKALPPAPIVAICDSWIGWLERNTDAGLLPSEFSFGVGEILLSATRLQPDLRQGRIARLLAFQGTGALMAFVAHIVDHWDDLIEDERTALLNRLEAGRSDDRWLQAAALTRSDVPEAAQVALLPPGVSLRDSSKTLLAKVDPGLLSAAVHVHTGQPQPLWWLGTHNSGDPIWNEVVESIARTPTHPLFELAWDHVAFGGDERTLRANRTPVNDEWA